MYGERGQPCLTPYINWKKIREGTIIDDTTRNIIVQYIKIQFKYVRSKIQRTQALKYEFLIQKVKSLFKINCY